MDKTINGVLVVFIAMLFCCFSCKNKPLKNKRINNQSDVSLHKSHADKPINFNSTSVICDNYAKVETKLGILTNNVWNKQAAGNSKWSQCIEKKTVGDSTIYGWSWSWPYGKTAIYGYPQIKVGSSPWDPEPKFDERFPMAISQLERLNVSIDVETTSNGNYNLATSMWLISEPNQGSKPNKSIIAAEIMFWTYATVGQFNPAGQKYGEVIVAGESWEVWYEKNWSDASLVNKNRWVYISFKAKKMAFKTNINALELLRYAIQEKLISENLLIADIELGNEVMSGEGTTWVQDFKIQTELKSFD